MLLYLTNVDLYCAYSDNSLLCSYKGNPAPALIAFTYPIVHSNLFCFTTPAVSGAVSYTGSTSYILVLPSLLNCSTDCAYCVFALLYVKVSYIESVFDYRVRIAGYQILGNQENFLKRKEEKTSSLFPCDFQRELKIKQTRPPHLFLRKRHNQYRNNLHSLHLKHQRHQRGDVLDVQKCRL